VPSFNYLYNYFCSVCSSLELSIFWQIRTEEMDLIAERGIAAHYTGRVFGSGLVRRAMANGRSSRGKNVCLNNANIALRVFHQFFSLKICDN
jgi:hypothetical protein